MSTLDADDLKRGLEFIVGTWQIDYLVNAWSNNLDHIPATEFKGKDGKNLSQVSFEFFEDHTMKYKNGDIEGDGTWEQKSWSKYAYKCDKFLGEMPPEMAELLKEFERSEGGLVFGLGLLVVRMKKVAEGVVTKEPDIGDLVPTEDDLKMNAIVGRWKIYKALSCIGEDFGLHTRDEVVADLDKKKAAGQIDDHDYTQEMHIFGAVYEFTAEHRVRSYTSIPEGVPQEEIDKAVASGQVKLVNGMMCVDEEGKEWKYVKGDYWYNTGEKRMLFDEEQSPWDKITPDSEGHINMNLFILEKEK